MINQTKRTMIKLTVLVAIISVLLICGQYIFTKINTGKNKEITQLANEKALAGTTVNTDNINDGQYLRLTDLEWRSESKPGYGKLTKNGTDSGAKISIKREGAFYTFDYGIYAHADSNVYYNIEEYSQKYRYLTMYVGLNQTSTKGDGVKFWVYTSTKDKFATSGSQNWDVKPNELTGSTEVDILPGQEAVKVKIDISGAKYLRLQANKKTGNGADHSVYVDPMLITEAYQEKEALYDITTYDNKIKEYEKKHPNVDKATLLNDEEYEHLVLKRKFVSCLGNYALQRFTEESPDNQATIDWLMNDVENLRYYIMGGTPTGGYYNSLNVLTRLLKEYKTDFEDQTQISDKGKALLAKKSYTLPITKGNLYKRMAITLSLTHSTTVRLWMQNSATNQSDAVTRYSQYKYMYNNGMLKATEAVDMTPWFETYTIEEMRFVMNVALDDEEMIWLNEYTQSKIDEAPARASSLLTPHSYIAYVWPNYQNAVYYDDANYEYFNELYGVPLKDANGNRIQDEDGNVKKKLLWPDKNNPDTPNYGISRSKTGEPYIYKLWMNLRNKFGTGAVCGGISKLGHCIRGSHAIPSGVIGQPGHAAIIYYNVNSAGKGYWGIDNDVSGWTKSEKGERLLLGWGNDNTYVKGYNIPYIEHGQEGLNDYTNLQKAEELLMTVDLYETNAEKEAIYNKAIEAQSFNLDAWAGLVKLYLADNTKKEADYYNLAERMMNGLKHFPFGMANLADKIKPKFVSNEYVFKYTMLYTRMLEYGKNYRGTDVQNPALTRLLATSLLGQLDTSLATFSFDGADAGKIVLGSRFDGSGVRWDYCLKGKDNSVVNNQKVDGCWKEVSFTGEEEHKWQLTQEEINSITAENDIYIHIVGANYSDDNLYKIDILESAGLPTTIFANDRENRVVAVNLSTEWRYKETDEWTSYGVSSPDLTGDKTVQLRQGATGVRLPSNESQYQTFTFTADTDTEERKYVPVSHLSLHSVSTQATSNGGAAVNALDANYNTRFHSAWNGTDTQRYMVVKLDEPMYISAVEFIPAGGGNGRIVDGTIYGSMTGEEDSWVELSTVTGIKWPQQANDNVAAENQKKNFEVEKANRKKVQYIKIHASKTNGNWFTARAFNFYQDLTIEPTVAPTASVGYSTTEKTNEPVVARLINASTDIIITNNDGKDTYVFTENGEFTFEFMDQYGNKGSTTANVTWIDSKVPDADIKYELSDDLKLKAILENITEDVYLLDANNNKTNYIEVNDNGAVESITYYDARGNTYKVAELDEDRFTTKITYTNTKTEQVPEVKYYITSFEKVIDEQTKQEKIVTTRTCYDGEGNPINNINSDKMAILRTLEETRSNPLEIYLENEQEYEFKLLDTASNIAYKNIKVDFIENNTKILASDITYSTTMLTNQDVVATIKPYVIDLKNTSYEVEVVRKNPNVTENTDPDAPKVDPYEVVTDKTYTFKENGTYTFSYRRIKTEEEQGTELDMEVESHTARVNWIDKVTPTVEIAYNASADKKGITATIVNESEDIIVTNNGTNREYTFTKSGEFTFEFQDKAGNKATKVSKVMWGDVNDNKIMDPDDLAKAKLYYIGEMELDEKQLILANTDGDDEIGVNDIAQIKLAIIGEETTIK